MARRADHTREELTELAIAKGLELIREDGFSGFSGRKLAARIGYTIGTLYNVFGSYDDMLLHINARTLDEWFAFMQDALKKHSKQNPLQVLARAYIEYSRSHYQQWTVLFEYRLSDGRALPAWYAKKMTRFFTLVEEALHPHAGKDGKLATRAGHVLWAAIHGICVLSLSGKLDLVNAETAETLAGSFIENYMAGLKSKR